MRARNRVEPEQAASDIGHRQFRAELEVLWSACRVHRIVRDEVRGNHCAGNWIQPGYRIESAGIGDEDVAAGPSNDLKRCHDRGAAGEDVDERAIGREPQNTVVGEIAYQVAARRRGDRHTLSIGQPAQSRCDDVTQENTSVGVAIDAERSTAHDEIREKG